MLQPAKIFTSMSKNIFLPLLLGTVLTGALTACHAVKPVPGVFAEMYRKSKTPVEGFVPHTAEGKNYFIQQATEVSFYPGEDSYNQMHHHGVAFESAYMAYRIYFDKKQTIDIYAKRTPRLELDACKWYPTDEQLENGFGDDILRVSGAIGVGACKPWNGSKMIHFDDVLCRTQRIVEQDAKHVVCEVVDSAWLAPDGKRHDLTTRYTLYSGHRDVMVEVMVDEPLDCLVTGVMGVPVANANNYLIEGGLVGSWGTAYPVNDTVKYAKETVGLGVYVPKEYVAGNVQDKNNNLVLLRPATYIRYWLVATGLKENTPAARTEEDWYAYLRRWSSKL